jgi:methyl-accepting chemotaxis protein
MREIADGNLEIVPAGLGRRDEIGDMAAAVDSFKQKAIEKIRLEAELEEKERAAVERRKAEMLQLAKSFEAAVGGIVQAVSASATELEAAAGTMTNTAEETRRLSTTVASASEQASGNVQSVASATDEMSSSVAEIGRQVQESAQIARQAVQQAQSTDSRISELSQAAQRIGDVVKLITAIAEQTNARPARASPWWLRR